MEGQKTMSSNAPVFLLGVPRSGTTLLRMMIDSHPDIMCGPEAHWIANRNKDWIPSLRNLAICLTKHEFGAVKSLKGVDEDLIYRQTALFIDEILSASVKSHGKKRWAEKTPKNITDVPFLYRLFPNAKFVHIYRDGRDVALSTLGKWKTIPYFDQELKNNYKNALKRWVDWNQRFWDDTKAKKINYLSVRYEDLAAAPEEEIRKVLDFIEAEWSDKVMSPYEVEHDVITMKGAGMQTFYNRKSIDTAALYRWEKELNWWQKRTTKAIAEETLLKLGYKATE